MRLGKGAFQSYSPLRAGRERGVSPRDSKGNLSFCRAEGGSQAVFWAFTGRHGEPRKRPGPDVIGHQLTVLRARAPPTAAAVAVADVAATAVPPPAAGLGTAATRTGRFRLAGRGTGRARNPGLSRLLEMFSPRPPPLLLL